MIPPDHLQAIAKISGNDGMSAGLRAVVAAGLAVLQGDAPATLAAVDELDRLADRLASITGRRTPSGAWWAPNDAAMPERTQLAPQGDVVASPNRVVLAGASGALMVDLNHQAMEAQDPMHAASQPVDLHQLIGLAVLLPAAIIRLANTGPGREEVADGLTVERRDSGSIVFNLRGVITTSTVAPALQFCSELLSLATRGIQSAVDIRAALDRQLQVTP